MTRTCAPSAPALPVMPPTGRVSCLVAELGLAMGGVRDPCYCAFAWRYARDERALWKLHRYLLGATLKTARRLHWPYKMRGRRYLHKLVWLALWDEHNWWWIRQGKAWPRLIDMDDELWNHRVAQKYVTVRDQLDRWCSEAHRVAQERGIREL
jgi:hypothetical protein